VKPLMLVFFLFLMSLKVLAAGGSSAHNSDSIPWDKIGWQAANLGLLLIGIFYFIKKSAVTAFKNRQKNYLDQFEKTKVALKSAEVMLAGIKEKLTSLEAGEKKSVESAQHEADILKAQIISEAVSASEKIKNDTEITINNELNRAKLAINHAILNQALAATAKTLSEKTKTSPEQTAAQEAAFVKQIEQVKT